MKRIFYPILLLALIACKETKQTSETATTAPSIAKVQTDTTATQVDGITSATSKPNQVSFNGTIVLSPQRQATVALTMGGVVRNTSLLPGQQVQKGTLLATLENPDFIMLQQTYLDSHAQTEYLQAEYERQKSLSAEQAASQKKFQQSKADYLSMKSKLEATAAQLSLLGITPEELLKSGIQPLLQVKAPISGYISDVTMADMKVGSPVQFRVNGMGKTVFKATLVSIGQKVDETSRSLEVYARIDSTAPQFRPGMYVTARIQK